MLRLLHFLIIACALSLFGPRAKAEPAGELVGAELLREANTARAAYAEQITNTRYMTVIDYRARSHVPRFYLVDLSDMSAKAYLVAHGKGSDPNHDGMADIFSNIQGSKMTSLGSFLTGPTYVGAHGLSLKLYGLEAQNDMAEDRLIVIHGASYVSPTRRVLGRSWGCPALEPGVAQTIIPLIKDGAFLYVVGTPPLSD